MKHILILLFIFLSGFSYAQISIVSNEVAVTQNFDAIGSSGTAPLPSGWKVSGGTDYSTAASATTLAYGTSGTGAVTSSSSGGTINWANGITATSTDRAIGFLTSGSYSSPRNLFTQIINNTGTTISSITIYFDIEKYRSGSRAWNINFYSSSDGTSWTTQIDGDQAYAADANNTVINNPPTTVSKSVTISGLSLANGASYYLRWAYTGTGGSTNSQGLGIDNFSITTTGTGGGTDLLPPTITYTALSSTCNTAARTLTASISDPSGVAVATANKLPVLYWKINSGTYTASSGTWISGTNYEFTFGAGATAGDSIKYYIVAQDSAAAPNIGSYPSAGASGFTNDPPAASTPPTSPSYYTILSTLSGVYTIDNSIVTGGRNFANFNDAISALNSSTCVSGPITFHVSAGQSWNVSCAVAPNNYGLKLDLSYTNSTYTISFRKFGTGANPILNILGTSATNDAGILINGTDYITFDGIDIQDIGTSASDYIEYGYYILNASSTNGSQNDTIKNAKIVLNRTNPSSRAIFQNATVTPINSGGANSYNCFQNLSIENTYSGIYITGNSSNPDLNTEVSHCTIGASTANDIGNGSTSVNAMRITSNSDVRIFNNEVRNVSVTGSTNLYGIYIESLLGTSNQVFNNKIHDLESMSTSTSSLVYALRTDIISGMSCSVYNNIIYSLRHGIITPNSAVIIRALSVGVAGTGTGNIYFNTVKIDEDSVPSSAAFYVGNGTINAQNNIFSNFSEDGITSKRYCIYRAGGSFGSLDNNDYYIDTLGTGNNVGYYSSDKNTLSDWKAVSLKDTNSLCINPLFTSSIDLTARASELKGSGVAISGITSDFFDSTRTSNDIGAINVTPIIACTAAIGGTASVTGSSSFCVSGTPVISCTGYSTGTDYSYQWQYSNDNFASDIHDFVGQTNPASLTTGVVSSSTYYRLKVSCSYGTVTDFSNVITITINALPTVSFSGLNASYCLDTAATILIGSPAGGTFSGTGISGSNFSPATAGTYSIIYSYIDANSCSNTSSQNVTVNNPSVSSETKTECNTYTWNGTTYTASGDYTKHFTNYLGCDSAATLHLTINHSTSGSETITECNTYTWDGTTYTTSGDYVKHYTNYFGCDSTATLHLTINYSTSGSETKTECNTYTWDGTTYTTSGDYVKHYTNYLGCDSTATLHLTINHSTSSSETKTECNTYTWNGTTYTASGDYTKHFTNYLGCDSAATLHLTIKHSDSISQTAVACNSYTWAISGLTYTSSGIYTKTYLNSLGCDSIISLHLTINHNPTVVINSPSTICNGGNVDLTATTITSGSTSGLTFTYWTDASTSIPLANPTLASVGTYYIKGTTEASCFDTAVIKINEFPLYSVGSISGNQTICYNSVPSQLVGIAPTGGNMPYSYQWQSSIDNTNFSDITAGGTSLNYNPSALTSTTYYRLKQTSANGCGVLITDTVVVSVNPKLISGVISANQTICLGSPVNAISITSPYGGTGTYTYQWQRNIYNSGLGWQDLNGEINQSYQPNNPSSSRGYRIKITSGTCGTVISDSSSLTINQLPIVALPVNFSLLYNADTVIRSLVSGGTGSYLYEWTPTTNIASATNMDSIVITNLTTQTTFQLKATDANSMCFKTASVTVSMIGGPLAVSLNYSDDTICKGQPVLLTALKSGGSAPYSFEWSSSADNFATIFSSLDNLTVNPSVTTTYRIVLNDATQSDTAWLQIVVNPLPTVSFTGLANSYCIDATSSVLNASPLGGDFSGAGWIGTDFKASIAGVGNHTITYTFEDANGCIDSAQHNTTVNSLPVISMSSLSDACINSAPNSLTNAAPTGGTYTGVGVNSSSFDPAVAGIGSHYITYTFMDANSCTNSDSTIINVVDIPLVTSISTQVSVTGTGSWSPISGNVGTGYEMCLDPTYQYYYVDIDNLTSSVSLKSGVLNPFKLSGIYPAAFYSYWAAKGVVSGATGWQSVMWDIINGNAPMFYIKYNGSDYTLVDGLQYQIGQGENPLRISGDYPQDMYKFKGLVEGNYCYSDTMSINFKLNTQPVANAGSDVTITIGQSGATIGTSAVVGYNYLWTPATGLNDATIAQPIANPSDTTEYILTVTNGICSATDTVIVNVKSTFPIGGTVTYDNSVSTPLNGLKLYLHNSTGSIIDSTTTNSTGAYTFTPQLDGDYTVSVISNIAWGGVNSADALVIQRNFAGLLANPLFGIRLRAGNTNNDVNGIANSGDALLIKRRFATLIGSFTSGDWTFNPDTIRVNGAAVTMNFKGLCYGDVNGTYVPTGAKGQASVELNKVGTMVVNTNTVDIPVKITHMMSTGAISMVLTYPVNALDVISVSSAADNISGLVYSIKNGKIYLAWSSLQPFNVQANDVVFSIKANVLSTSSSIDLGVSSISEFTDVDANVIPQVSLYYPELIMPTSISKNTGNNISISNYPNPFTNSTIISYELPVEGQVFIGIYDVNGKLIRIATNENQTIGKHIIDLDGENLAEGLYHVQMIVSSGSKVIVGGSTLMKIK